MKSAGVHLCEERTNKKIKLEPPEASDDSSGFRDRFQSGHARDTPEIKRQITRAYGILCIIVFLVAVSTTTVYSFSFLTKIFNFYSVDLVLAVISFFVSYCALYHRETKCQVEKVELLDLFLITSTSTFICIYFTLGDMRDRLTRSLLMLSAALILTFFSRHITTKVHPLILYIIVGTIVASAHIGIAQLLPGAFYLGRAIYPTIYMLTTFVYIDCVLHVTARNQNTWRSHDGVPSVASLVRRVFLQSVYFPHAICVRLGFGIS